jgi:hypothetical protein
MTAAQATPEASFDLPAPAYERYRWEHVENSAACYVPLTTSLNDRLRGAAGRDDNGVPPSPT